VQKHAAYDFLVILFRNKFYASAWVQIGNYCKKSSIEPGMLEPSALRLDYKYAFHGALIIMEPTWLQQNLPLSGSKIRLLLTLLQKALQLLELIWALSHGQVSRLMSTGLPQATL
jgi:hypothetical protein